MSWGCKLRIRPRQLSVLRTKTLSFTSRDERWGEDTKTTILDFKNGGCRPATTTEIELLDLCARLGKLAKAVERWHDGRVGVPFSMPAEHDLEAALVAFRAASDE